ncbi:spore germination protein (amino acid permease) [Thalassobacillus cyri]|uniref:Spore germination protein (Amino acid permease) n=1 Tax=Thalassobacillus cyri TaxID=571932 RepID=A0A1H4H1S4_9BACI|nr:GerAB/ArcD/ProY family transporter [Thalassobacillus cyri]SEB15068.1 spore germination protein (amino acid permease) [Thalassobacillus cyri]
MANPSNTSGTQSQQKRQKISLRQFFFLIVQTQIGVGVLTLPYDLQKAAGHDGWISLLLASLLLQIVLLFFWLLAKRFPDKDLPQYTEKILGKWAGKVTNLFFSIYFIAVAALVLVLYSRILKLWILPETPKFVVVFLMIMAGIYMVCCSVTVMARIYTLLSGLLVMLFIALLYVLTEIQIVYLLPIGKAGWTNILNGINAGVLSFLGFIIILFIYPFVQGNDKQKLKTIFFSHWFVLVFYLYTLFVTFGFFGPEEIKLVPSPVLYSLKAFEFSIVSRLDMFFLSIWVVSVSTSFTAYLFMAGTTFTRILNAKSSKHFFIWSAVLILAVTYIPGEGKEDVEKFGSMILKFGYLFSGILPFLLFIVALLRRKRTQGSDTK